MSDDSIPTEATPEPSEKERQVLADLSDLGVAITEEDPSLVDEDLQHYVVVGMKVDDGSKLTAQGDSRLSALKALLIIARAS